METKNKVTEHHRLDGEEFSKATYDQQTTELNGGRQLTV